VIKTRKKLIEVALPLEAINAASAREKSIRHGHPSTLHLWWARRPLAAARAVIFSQMVDDPSEYVDELLAVADNRQRAEQELVRRRVERAKVKEIHEQALRDGKTSVAAPGTEATLQDCAGDLERERLFDIIKQLVLWENTTNEAVLSAARDEILRSWRRTCADNHNHPRAKELFNPENLPSFHDPFAGGGTLPLEAQRLGLEAYASDLNPVAVLINKAMIEIPPKFAGKPPVNPESRKDKMLLEKAWHGTDGLAEDVRYYGKWIRDEAERRIGHLYPKVEITADMARDRLDLKPLIGQKLTVIAWLWARTVKSPNPAFSSVEVPLVASFLLATKPGKEAYVEPVIEPGGYRFSVKMGKSKTPEATKNGTKLARGANFRCLMSNTPMSEDYVRSEFLAKRIGKRLMATVAEGDRSRIYLPPTADMEILARTSEPAWRPEQEMNQDSSNLVSGRGYGITHWHELFTARQLVSLTTFCDLIDEVRGQVKTDARSAGLGDDMCGIEEGGTGAQGYSDAIAAYLAFGIDRTANYCSMACTWHSGVKYETVTSTFGRQALPMTWDFAEANPFSEASGNWLSGISWIANTLGTLPASRGGFAKQVDAALQSVCEEKIVSTDPPYYDNIGYADLSDFFYLWLRQSLKSVFPELFSTLAVPKGAELVATPYRHGSKEKAEIFFLNGMTQAMRQLAVQAHSAFPVTIYYAFKQSETESESGTSSTGWETFLDAVLRAGFALTGTWPMRTEYTGNLKKNVSALASSIVLVCRQRSTTAAIATRREFIISLKAELPTALIHLQRGNIAPVDFAQAAIGPGMAVYTRYSRVVDAEGQALPVREALTLINQTLDEVLAEQESDFDADTRWALAWFEQSGFDAGEYGVAETLSKAKNTSVQGMKDAGILDRKSPGSKVRLLRPSELTADRDPVRDPRLTVWEVVHHLVRRLESGGEAAAAELVSVLGGVSEVARELAYRLYTICERKKRAQEALSYNALVQSWPEISRLAREERALQPAQKQMFEQR
jgi:putative DNA methylase